MNQNYVSQLSVDIVTFSQPTKKISWLHITNQERNANYYYEKSYSKLFKQTQWQPTCIDVKKKREVTFRSVQIITCGLTETTCFSNPIISQ